MELIPVDSTGSVASVGSELGHVLTGVRAWFSRFICVTDDLDLDLITLWTAHTYVAMETYTSPRLIIDSTMFGSGKTTVLEHLSKLTLAPVQAASLSSPALLTRMLSKGLRTILIDEVDRSLDPKRPGVDDLIAILNSGYKRGATRPVLVPAKGGEWEVSEMPTYSPVAMAGNAPQLPNDTRSRSIRLLLMPDLEGRVEESDWEEIEPAAFELAALLAAAMDGARDFIRTSRPAVPEGCTGRFKERWSPLKRVATAAGGNWPAVTDELIKRDLKEAEIEKEEGLMQLPPAVVLLRDIFDVWPDGTGFVPSVRLVSLLIDCNPMQWGPMSPYGKELNVQRMGRMLVQAFKIHSTRLGDSPRGYPRSAFEMVWRRSRIGSPIQTDGSDGTGRTDGRS